VEPYQKIDTLGAYQYRVNQASLVGIEMDDKVVRILNIKKQLMRLYLGQN
jgi:hypothetical protein